MSNEPSESSHPNLWTISSSKDKGEPDKGRCHVYFAHQDGRFYWEPNTIFRNETSGALSGSKDNTLCCGKGRLTLMSVTPNISIVWKFTDTPLDIFQSPQKWTLGKTHQKTSFVGPILRQLHFRSFLRGDW